MRDSTAKAYGDRLTRVVDHIARNLDGVLALDRLAEVACLSPWHFHRVYRAIAGETVAETVRRLRLHRAAVDLTRSERSVAQVARRAGFGSAAAFNRAFSAAYGLPPVAYARARRQVPADLSSITSTQAMENSMYKVEIRQQQPVRLATVAHRGDYTKIGTAFDRIFLWAGARGLIRDGDLPGYGVYFDDPAQVPASRLRSLAGIPVAPDFAAETGIEIFEIKAGRVATVLHRGPYAELEAAYRHLYQAWLPQSGEEPGDAPCFEVYLNSPRTVPAPDWLTEVCLPLR